MAVPRRSNESDCERLDCASASFWAFASVVLPTVASESTERRTVLSSRNRPSFPDLCRALFVYGSRIKSEVSAEFPDVGDI